MGRYARLCQTEGDELGCIKSGDFIHVYHMYSLQKSRDTICVLTNGRGLGYFLKYDKQVN